MASLPRVALRTPTRRLRAAVARRLGVDERALAALRVLVGVALLADLLRRSGDVVAFYTDAGVLPRAALHEAFPAIGRLSLHAVSGAAWVQGLLFVAAAGLALALLLGYRTRLAVAGSWVLLVSLHARNPVLVNGGDSLLRRLLFWSLFLPLGARWSVDALRAGGGTGGACGDSVGDGASDTTGPDGDAGAGTTADTGPPTAAGDRVVTVAAAALLVQVVVVYFANGLFKLRGDLWLRGDAVRYVLGLDRLTLLLGDVLAGYPAFLGLLDRLWLALVLAAPLLVVLAGRARAALVGLYVAMHVGMALTLRLGVFPLVSVAALVPFLPAPIWDRVGDALRVLRRRVAVVGGGVVAFRESVGGTLPRWPLPGAARVHAGRGGSVRRVAAFGPRLPAVVRTAGTGLHRRWRRVRPAVVAGLLAVVLVWNAATLGHVALPDGVASAAGPREHRWDMFAPEPRREEGWYVVPARLESGGRVDALRGSAVRWDRPPDEPAVRWRTYLLAVSRPGAADLRRQFAAYLCRRWNARHADEVVGLSLFYVSEPTRLDAPDPTHRTKLLDHSCGG